MPAPQDSWLRLFVWPGRCVHRVALTFEIVFPGTPADIADEATGNEYNGF